MKTQNDKEQKELTKQNRKIVLKRLIFDAVVFLLLIIPGTILLRKSLNIETEDFVKYQEKSKLDYKVYLLDNDFYDEKYLGKDMLYVSNLIDKVAIDFNYAFASDVNENIDFSYTIAAKLSIDNPTGTKSYFSKVYTLVDNKSVKMTNSKIQNIMEQVSINYPYYNALASGFKSQYGVDVLSKLTVYMVVNKKNAADSKFTLDNNSVMNIAIPLSERSVDIRMDYKEINETSSIIQKRELTYKDFIPVGIAVLMIALSLVMFIKAFRNFNRLLKKKSAYRKYVEKILKEYDRLIAESSTLLSFADKEIINISKFTELLDIHDNLQVPIMYYELTKDKESYFYISHENVIYLLHIKAEDMENGNYEK